MTEFGDAGAARSMVQAFDYVHARFVTRLAGLSDDEYFWEPVPGCWSLRRSDDTRWRLDGTDGRSPLDPSPFTTIAWRIGHVGGLALGGFTNRLFSDGSRAVDDIEFPSSALDAIAFLDAAYGEWRRGVIDLPSPAWSRALGQGWGPYATSTVLDLALHVLDELVHHAAEIALLRDLYARQRQ